MLTSNLMPISGADVKPMQTTKAKKYIPHNKADFWWLTMANGSKLKGYKKSGSVASITGLEHVGIRRSLRRAAYKTGIASFKG